MSERTMTADDVNTAARALSMWRKAPSELDEIAAEFAAHGCFTSDVIAEAARQVAVARRAIGVNDDGSFVPA